MVDDVGYATVVPMVGHHPDVVFKNHNVPALPLVDVVDVDGEGNGGAGKVDLQVPHPAEVDVFIGGVDVIVLRMGADVCVHQLAQIVPGMEKSKGHYVGADPVSVVGITAGVVPALIFWLGGDVVPDPLEEVGLVVDAVPIPVHRTDHIRNAEIGVGFGGDGGITGA